MLQLLPNSYPTHFIFQRPPSLKSEPTTTRYCHFAELLRQIPIANQSNSYYFTSSLYNFNTIDDNPIPHS